MTMKNPPHPGDFIRTEIIQPSGLSVTAAAEALRRAAAEGPLITVTPHLGNWEMGGAAALGINSFNQVSGERYRVAAAQGG